MNRRRILASLCGGWKNPYVTDGLELYYDGQWNVEGGVHDGDLKETWNDLSGNNRHIKPLFKYASAISGLGFQWGDKCLKSQGQTLNSLPYSDYLGGLFAGSLPEWSVSLCCKILNPGWNGWLFTNGVNNVTYGTGLDISGSNVTAAYFMNTTIGSANVVSGNRYNFTLTKNGSIKKLYIGKDIVFSSSSGGRNDRSSLTLGSLVGILQDGTVTGRQVGFTEYNRFSVYSKELDAQEISAIYEIDKARFGLT